VTSDCRTWDGYQLVRTFRQLECLAATTFVAITGHADDAGRKAAVETRFDIHVPSPADASKFEQFLIERRETIRHP
jgi:CheY-like chemotaxis protein